MPPTGFEPVISALKGLRPGPLDDGGAVASDCNLCAMRLRFAPKVPVGWLERLYRWDALGIQDEELLEKVAARLYARDQRPLCIRGVRGWAAWGAGLSRAHAARRSTRARGARRRQHRRQEPRRGTTPRGSGAAAEAARIQGRGGPERPGGTLALERKNLRSARQ